MRTRVPPSPCPDCGFELDGATSAHGEHEPKPGDLSVCIKCGAVLAFKVDLTTRLATEREVRAAGDELAHVVQVIKEMRQQH